MKPNKSIDGLVTRSDKISSRGSSSPKPRPKIKASKNSVPTMKKPATKGHSTPIPAKNRGKTPAPRSRTTPRPTTASSKTPKSVPKSALKESNAPSYSHEQALEEFLKPVESFNLGELSTSNSDHSESAPTTESTSKDHSSDSPSPNPSKPSKHLKAKKKPSKVRRIITIALLVIVISIIGLVTWLILWGNDIIAKITGGQGTVFDLITFVEETYDPLKTGANGRTNILAFGTSGYNMDGENGDGTHDGAQLTDSIMVISLNQDTGDIAMISLPRDLKASPTCTATGKINEVYWCSNMYGEDEAAGASALMAEVGDILGLDFQYYAHLNWGSLVSIVDILDGINVTLDEDIFDYGWTDAAFDAGVEYHINGEEALGLARARHGTMGGDFTRGASQQKILIGIKDKVLEKQLSITDLLGLASTLGDNLRTNFNLNELKTLAHLALSSNLDSIRQLSLVDYENGVYYMTTGTLDNGISYVFPAAGVGNYYAIQDYISTNLSNDPRIYESPTMVILNATGESGLAASERTKLEAEGYTVNEIGDALSGTYSSTYNLYTTTNTTNTAPGTKLMLEKYYDTDAMPASTLPEDIPKDYDFILIVGPSPAPSDSN